VRNRVAHDDARTTRAVVLRGVRVTALLAAASLALLVASAQVAAADSAVADERFSTGLGGLVGIFAVALGLGGLVAGLLRRRKISAARAATLVAAPQPQPEPAHSETAA
jgi:hypothetical protein